MSINIDYTADYTYYDSRKPHSKQMDNERRTDFHFPTYFVDGYTFNVPDFKSFPVVNPCKLGIDLSDYCEPFQMSKSSIREVVKTNPQDFWNVKYVASNDSLRFCEIDANNRFSKKCYEMINGAFQELKKEGFAIKDVHFNEARQSFKFVDIIPNEPNIFYTLNAKCRYNGFIVYFGISLSLKGIILLSCTAEDEINKSGKDGLRFNIFKNDYTHELVDIDDMFRSFNIGKKLIMEWMYGVKFARNNNIRCSQINKNINEIDKINPNIDYVYKNSEIFFDSDSERMRKSIEKQSMFTKLQTRHKKGFDMAYQVDSFMLSHVCEDYINDFWYKVDVLNKVTKDANGEFGDSEDFSASICVTFPIKGEGKKKPRMKVYMTYDFETNIFNVIYTSGHPPVEQYGIVNSRQFRTFNEVLNDLEYTVKNYGLYT